MNEDDKSLVRRLRERTSYTHMLLVDPPRPAPDGDCHQAADTIEARAADIERLRHVVIAVTASLAAAISLLERGGKAAKKAAPSDLMFDQMVLDYTASLEDARDALEDTK